MPPQTFSTFENRFFEGDFHGDFRKIYVFKSENFVFELGDLKGDLLRDLFGDFIFWKGDFDFSKLKTASIFLGSLLSLVSVCVFFETQNGAKSLVISMGICLGILKIKGDFERDYNGDFIGDNNFLSVILRVISLGDFFF